MGVEKVAAIHDSNVSSADFVKPTQTNDHSNPQQGSGAVKATMQEKEDHVRQNKKDRNPVPGKPNGPKVSNNGEDKRKLFVGGLPTDSKFVFEQDSSNGFRFYCVRSCF